MSSTCFEPEGSSSDRRLYVQVWYYPFTCKKKLYHNWKWKVAARQTGWRKETGEPTARK